MMRKYLICCLIPLLILQGGCIKNQKKDPYTKGELVTWKYSDELIVKTELGQRGKHIKDEYWRIEAQFYRPHLEHYVGQFPIDHQPKKYATLSKQEAQQMEYYKRDVSDWLEFDLMLNGSWVEPTDESIYSSKALDHEDQVKVRINYLSSETKRNTEESFNQDLLKYLDKNSEHELYGMKCFNLIDTNGKRCFKKSDNPKISGYNVLIFPNHNISVEYYEFIYGGVNVQYVLSQKNINQISQIDQNIWRILDVWNVVPK